MLRLLKLELGKIFKPVITTTAILTVLTCMPKTKRMSPGAVSDTP